MTSTICTSSVSLYLVGGAGSEAIAGVTTLGAFPTESEFCLFSEELLGENSNGICESNFRFSVYRNHKRTAMQT